MNEKLINDLAKIKNFLDDIESDSGLIDFTKSLDEDELDELKSDLKQIISFMESFSENMDITKEMTEAELEDLESDLRLILDFIDTTKK